MIRLNELFALLHIDCEDARILQGISDDTRDVKKDWLFVCRKGSLYDGAAFLQEALDKGAVVLCDQMLPMQHVYYTPHVERITQALLELYYGDLCTHLHVIGITGTNGKTSVASIISQLLKMEGCRKHSILQIRIIFQCTAEQSCKCGVYLAINISDMRFYKRCVIFVYDEHHFLSVILMTLLHEICYRLVDRF